eukprot:7697660-Pyramimonas_sp.AAC.1
MVSPSGEQADTASPRQARPPVAWQTSPAPTSAVTASVPDFFLAMSEKGGSPAAMPLRCEGISKRPPPGEPGGDPGGRADRSRSPPQGDE